MNKAQGGLIRMHAHRDAGQRLAQHTRARLRRERWLRWHVFLIALLMLAALWLGGTLLRLAGIESLAGRYALLLPLAYLLYLGLLRLWAGYLLSRQEAGPDGLDLAGELPAPRGGGGGGGGGGGSGAGPRFESGGGGDFAGGGASGDFSASAGESLGSSAIETGAEALGALDEGALVVVPLALVVGLLALLGALLGAGVFMLFGVEVLLAVAVEVALAALAGSLAWRRYRQHQGGWLGTALRHTWRGALGMLLLGVALGAAIDRWMPAAQSLPEAVKMLGGQR
jgi:hypothetical protein